MNSSPEQNELIEQYLKGKLSSSEKHAFEKKMQEDLSFSEEVNMQKMLNELVLEKGLSDIRKKVGEDMAPPSGSSYKKPVLITLAGILLTAGILYFFGFTSKHEKGIETNNKSKEVPSPVSEITEMEEQDKLKKKTQTSSETTPDKIAMTEDPLGQEDAKESDDPETNKQEAEKSTQDNVKKIDKVEEQSRKGLMETTDKDAPCPEIKFEIKTGPSCANLQNGTLEITPSSIHGGKGPYTYTIGENDFGPENSYTGLSAGTHRAAIKDSRGCVSQKEIHITEKVCFEPKDYSFNPETESWKFPFAEHESGSITITSKNGNVLYTAKILHGNPSEWNGRTSSGELLGSGTYVYIAQTEKGEVRQGYIVILH